VKDFFAASDEPNKRWGEKHARDIINPITIESMKTVTMTRKKSMAAALFAVLFGASPLVAAVQLAGLFNDHMVLQREMKVPVWATASPGEKVIVSFAGQTVSTRACPDGKWMVRLQSMKAAEEPRTMTVSGVNSVEVKDVLVGEIWICSGQSNMELTPPRGLVDPEPEIAAAHWPRIRMNLVEKVVAEKPLSDLKGSWAECKPEMMRRFSAAAYFFGREIHQKVGVPVGLIGAYYGGSNGQSWMRREVFESDPDLKNYLAQLLPPGTNAPVPLQPSSGGGPTSRYRPANFYNGMIAPIIPFAIRGVIWYQGEANTANARDAGLYAKLFSTMIQDWRTQWGLGDFPFIFVQLPTSEPNYPDPTDSAWARVRESQQKALAVMNTAMVVTIDLGEGVVVYAHNKRTSACAWLRRY
jgi:sialate O-acetylesterase